MPEPIPSPLPDDWWSTQTISRAMEAGYTHLSVHCAGCGHTTHKPLHRIPISRSRGCAASACGPGAPAPRIGVWRQQDAQGYTMRPR